MKKVEHKDFQEKFDIKKLEAKTKIVATYQEQEVWYDAQTGKYHHVIRVKTDGGEQLTLLKAYDSIGEASQFAATADKVAEGQFGEAALYVQHARKVAKTRKPS